jgi:hypothetical protein
MGKSDEKQTKERAHKATGESKQHKNKPSFDAATFEATDDGGFFHSQWRDLFRQLCEYKAQFGDCRVPQQYSANPKLGRWVTNQRSLRTNYRKSKVEENPTSMTAEHLRALDAIGFEWKSLRTTNWSVRFQQLCEFKEQFGHCNVPKRYSPNPKLGYWVSRQRGTYRLYLRGKSEHRKNNEEKSVAMTVEHIRALDGIGFVWGTHTTDWNVRFQQLCEFKEEFSDCLVPQQYSTNPKLGRWVSMQRNNYKLYQEEKSTSMTAEQIRALDVIGFDWGTRASGSIMTSRNNLAIASCRNCILPNPS